MYVGTILARFSGRIAVSWMAALLCRIEDPLLALSMSRCINSARDGDGDGYLTIYYQSGGTGIGTGMGTDTGLRLRDMCMSNDGVVEAGYSDNLRSRARMLESS